MVVCLGGWCMSQGWEKSMSHVLQAEDMQQQIIRETFHLVSKRDDNVCNFLEGGRQVLIHQADGYKSVSDWNKNRLLVR